MFQFFIVVNYQFNGVFSLAKAAVNFDQLDRQAYRNCLGSSSAHINGVSQLFTNGHIGESSTCGTAPMVFCKLKT